MIVLYASKLLIICFFIDVCASLEGEPSQNKGVSFVNSRSDDIKFASENRGTIGNLLTSNEPVLPSVKIWKEFFDQILIQTETVLDKNLVASFAGISTYIDLVDANQNIRNGNVYYYGNSIPLDSWLYNPGSNLFSIYSIFLDCIALKEDLNPSLQEEINTKFSELDVAQQTLEKIKYKAFEDWTAYKKKHSHTIFSCLCPDMTFSRFLRNKSKNFQVALKKINSINKKLEALLTKRYGRGYQIINDARNCVGSIAAADITLKNRYNMPVQLYPSMGESAFKIQLMGDSVIQANSFITYMPMYRMPDFLSVYKKWLLNSKLGLRKEFEIKNGSLGGNSEESPLMGRSSHINSLCFLTVSGSENSGSENENTIIENFCLKYSFSGLQAVDIQPGDWFDMSLVANYKDHIDQERSRGINFFGTNGALLMVPIKLILGFQPEIILTLEESTYDAVVSHFQENKNARISIGSIDIINDSTKNIVNKIHFDKKKFSLTIDNKNSLIPMFLGVVSRRF
ncbi:MAG: hypothetical protein Q8S21_06655 [Candidatus Paracaedibacteraceae bacterium]|nr:hypothetical protein [Candidatus Paracaedibacteraceae bacterium]